MREIDLIPREHVEWRRVRRWLVLAASMLAALIALTALGRAALAWQSAQERPRVAQAREATQQAEQQRTRLAELGARKAALDARLERLKQLQHPAWEVALNSVDAAAGTRLWLDRMTFGGGAPEPLPAGANPGAAAEPGAAASPPAAPPPARDQVIEVTGHAADHAAVSEFMRRLSDQSGVRAVRLLDTGLRRYSMTNVVDFTVSAKLSASPQELR